MFAEDGETGASEETVPDTPLHGYREGREDDIEGDVDKLKSSDPESSLRDEVSEGDESNFPEADKD
jgi:hypothetical protein